LSLASDGAAALVLADDQTAHAMGKAELAQRRMCRISCRCRSATSSIRGLRGLAARTHRERAAPDDLSSLVETHDCFTIAELIEYEAMGLVPEGQGARAIKDGLTEKTGRLPVNPSGGLKSKGHPIGATGVSMHVLAAMQLTGSAGDFQVKDARLAGIFNMGGAAVANYVSILERIR
jgi:acetyl-CoA C-acetyltransferase